MTNLNAKQLHNALLQIKPSIDKNSIMPIMDNFLLTFKDGSIECTASNLQFFTKTKIPFTGDAPEKPIIFNPKFLTVIKDMKDIELSIGHDDMVVMTSGKDKIRFSSEYTDYPKTPSAKEWKTIMSIDAQELIEIFSTISPMVSSDELRPAMTGIHFRKSIDGPIIIEGSDGHVLAKKEKDFILNNEFDFILRQNLPQMKQLSGLVTIEIKNEYVHRIIKKQFDGVEKDVDESYIMKDIVRITDQAGMEIITRIIDERYPQVDSAIPDNSFIRSTINISDCLKSFEKGKNFTSNITNKVEFKIKKNQVELYYEDIDESTEYSQQLNCKTVADPEKTKDENGNKITVKREPEIHIGFNYKKFKIAFGHIKGDATIHMSTPNRAALIKENGWTFLLMPVIIT